MIVETPPLVVAIGDVHGQSDLLRRLLGALPRLEDEAGAAAAVYFLGDLVDRGPDSAGVIDLVIETWEARPASRLLLGNHDEWFRRFLSEPGFEEAETWLDQGGRETLASYGRGSFDLEAARQAILTLHPAHLQLLAEAAPIVLTERFAFVHAGVDPSRPLKAQDPHDCIWIRAPFMKHVGRLSHVVIHGHTPQKARRPTATENRLSMDTGAFFSGILSAVVIEEDGRRLRFVAATRRGVEPIEPVRLDRGLGTVLDAFG